MKKPLIWSAAVWLVGLLVAASVANYVAQEQQAEASKRLNNLVQRASTKLVQRLQVYEYGLRGARGAVIAAGIDTLSRDAFKSYIETRDLRQEFPGARGFGFIRKVPRAQEASFLRAARADKMPDFKIHEMEPHDGDRLVVQYLEPIELNRTVIGLDIASEADRRQAAMQAIFENRAMFTRPVTLMQSFGRQMKERGQGFLLLLPVYRPGLPLKTPEERLHAAVGLAYAPLTILDMLDGLDFFADELSLKIYDVDPHGDSRLFYQSDAQGAADPHGLQRQESLWSYGRNWRMEFQTTPAFFKNLHFRSPRQIAAQVAGFFTLLAGLMYLLMVNMAQRRRAAVDDARLSAIVDSSSDCIFGQDLEGRVISWNRAAEQMFGYAAHEVIGRTLCEMFIPQERQAEERELLATVGQGRSVPQFLTVRTRRDGSRLEVAVTASPIMDADGKVVGISKTVRDVTQERLAEDRFRMAVEAAPTAMLMVDEQQTIILASRHAEELFGYSGEELLGMPIGNLIPRRLREAHVHFVHDYQKKPVARPMGRAMQLFGLHKSGREIPVEVSLNPVQTKGGMATLASVADISRRLELEQQLQNTLRQHELAAEQAREAQRKAEEASHAKSTFLANMSHEIRTPMNAILGMCYLLDKQKELPEVSRDMVGKIHVAGRSLLGIINDILDFSKIEAHRLEIESVPFLLNDVLDNLASIMSSSLGNKPVELLITPVPAQATYLRGDGMRLGQVLVNLASNAIKFTDQGEVVVRVDLLGVEASGGVRLRFSVRDTGPGIAKDKQEFIFQAFNQADSSTTRRYGGTGLGLTISARLVALMGGTLEVASELGKGSEFSFVLSFQTSNPEDSVLPEMSHLRVLVADDHPATRKVLLETVASLGWHADAVASGEQAVAQVRDLRAADYDVLLLDWRMPGLDGLQAAAQIRQLQRAEKAPAIIMVTAYDRDALRREPQNQVADVVLNKPLTSSILYNAVLTTKRSSRALHVNPGHGAQQQRLAGLRILIVDDSEINREVAEGILVGEGASVAQAQDGGDAMALLTSQTDAFDVVLMDMQMPILDGYAATRQIRETPALSHLPVIALSAGALKTQRDQALAAGVDDFVAKPFEVEQLMEVIVRLARRQPNQGRQAPQGTTPQRESSAREVSEVGTEFQVLNIAHGLRVCGQPAVLSRFLRKFLATHGEVAAQMATYERESAAALAHKVKGAAAQIGLDALAQVAARLERGLKAGDEVQDVFLQLEEAMSAAKAAIEHYVDHSGGK
jgi:PAS domain S-box-containing protein